MQCRIPDVLSEAELTRLQSVLATADFVDGSVTAGWYARQVKQNQQLSGPAAQELRTLVTVALKRHPLFQAAVRPKHIHSVLLSRYTAGMAYGRHTDNALMGAYRSDVSFTLFLNAPEAYDGGDLVIEGADDERSYKLPAGMALVYPSSTLHRVAPVTRGMRLVAVGWVQSWIRDPAHRELLFDLDTVRRSLYAQSGKTDECDLLCKSLANLMRQWSE